MTSDKEDIHREGRMAWFLYAVLCAFFWATTDALSKKVLPELDEFFVAWLRFVYTLPFFVIMLFFIHIPEIDATFWVVNLILFPVEVLAMILYLRAIKISPLSLTMPFLSLTPVFLICTSYFMLGETPDKSGIFGILFIAAGAYILHFHTVSSGLLEPFRMIRKEKGSMLMILVAFLYSITSNLGKLAVLHSSPVFFSVFYGIAYFFILTPFVKSKLNRGMARTLTRNRIYPGIGVSFALMILFHNLSVNLVQVAYMISVKRTSMLFAILYGWALFGEENIRERFLGSLLMIAGVVLITII